MLKIYSFIITISLSMVLLNSCSKKSIPAATTLPTSTALPPEEKKDSVEVIIRKDTLVATKPVIKRKPKESIPKIITVNDKYAGKSVDGRLYYDLKGHRYWRNNKDGKYYIFNKSMLNDDAFKKPK